MKFLSTLALVIFAALPSAAQSLSLFGIDTTNFPTMKAKFYAFDAAGQPVKPNIGDVSINEDGTPRTVTNITCPPSVRSTLSVCIMVDTKYFVGLARAGTERLVNLLDMPQDELGITVMQSGVQIHHDFTRDRAKALAAAETIPSAPGVNVQAMFYAPITGGVPFISGQKADKKVLILISDLHCPKLNLNEPQFYADAAKDNITVYSILLNANDYTGLFKRVATNTKGKVFEKVTTELEITNIFQEIVQQEHWQNQWCEITWRSDTKCQVANTKVELLWKERRAYGLFSIPTAGIASLSFAPSYIFCKNKPVGILFDTTIIVTAHNANFVITNISSDNAIFDIDPKTFSLNNGQSQIVTIHYTPIDSGFVWAKFDIQSNECPQTLFARGGFLSKKPNISTLKLTHPNGGEIFLAGSDSLITWEGIPATDTVRLEFSNDNGATWQMITEKATGFRYIWHNIPPPSSNSCFIRVNHLQHNTGINDQIQTLGHLGFVNYVCFSPDGTKVATASLDYSARIWDSGTGILLRDLKGHSNRVYDIKFSPDNAKVATAGWDNSAKIWDIPSGMVLHDLKEHTDGVIVVGFSPDGAKLVTGGADSTARIWDASTGILLYSIKSDTGWVHAVSFSPDGTKLAIAFGSNQGETGNAQIWDIATGTLLHDLKGHTNMVDAIHFSTDGTKVITGSYDNTAKIWDATSGALLANLIGHTRSIYSVDFSPDGTKVVTGGYDKTAKIWSVSNGKLLCDLTGHNDRVTAVCFSPDGTKVATASYDKTAKIWDAASGLLLRDLKGHTSRINSITYSIDGTKIATASDDNSAKIWQLNIPSLQSDISDAFFSIIAPEPVIQVIDIDMGKTIVGDYNDNNEPAVICNRGTAPLHVLGLDVTSGDTQDFMISRGAGEFFLLPGECQDITFTFTPTRVGKRLAKATLRTTVGDIIDTIIIHGEGIAPLLQVETPMVNFGKVLIGATKDTLVTVTIRNVGTAGLDIKDSHHDKPNDKDFITLTGSGSFTLAPGATHPMQFRFMPSDEGRTTGLLSFEYNGPGSPTQLQLIGEGVTTLPGKVEIANASINFGPVLIGSNKDSLRTITVRNSGMQDIDITNVRLGGVNATDFNILGGGGTFTLKGGDTARLDLRFTPSSIGNRSAVLLFEFSGSGSPVGIPLRGQGVRPTDSITLVAGSASAFPGEQINIPFILELPQNSTLSTVTGFDITLRYNSTLLFPADNSMTVTTSGNDALLTFFAPYNPADGELLAVPFIATLGDDTATVVKIEKVVPRISSGNIDIATRDGSFVLKGVCYAAGAARLYKPSGRAMLMAIHPNPAEDEAEIEFETSEVGVTTLRVFNALGIEVAVPASGEMEAGFHVANVRTADFGAGTYFIVMTTPTEVHTARFEVVR